MLSKIPNNLPKISLHFSPTPRRLWFSMTPFLLLQLSLYTSLTLMSDPLLPKLPFYHARYVPSSTCHRPHSSPSIHLANSSPSCMYT
ncbi:hypothetical protein GALMADRAFT_1218778 [Galerina marginata CBS 339.88]|uniref:Uncharacterized protein n=1 Tax=Galerina marginata (strain CBS 339.88) TaxID=685588 RepID=A0A067S4N2_GALM3|nr:hypothetical protein GALMADRAFT_1218778 [Galerina marginata CBS 339.88]